MSSEAPPQDLHNGSPRTPRPGSRVGPMLTRQVLVVDDEASIATQVAARLRAEGFVVDVAHDGPSAVARAVEVEPDLVVLDVMLPGFDGLEVCRRLHARRPVPVLMLTARDAETDVSSEE